MVEHSDTAASVTYPVIIYNASLEPKEVSFPAPTITGREIAELAGHTHPEQYVILRRSHAGGTEELPGDDRASLSQAMNEFWVVESDRTMRFLVDSVECVWPENFISGRAVRAVAGQRDQSVVLFLKRDGEPPREIKEHEEVDLSHEGLERFYTESPRPLIHIIFINDVEHKVSQAALNGAQIKALGGIESNYQLFLEQPGDDRSISNDDTVKIVTDERFYSLPPATFG